MARLKERHQLRADAFVELRIWLAPKSVRGSVHRFKYALAYVVAGVSVLRYDNEAGKGDHRHIGDVETEYHSRRRISCWPTSGGTSINGGRDECPGPFDRLA
jgi:Family of unknown function (DUF6516)